jgi:hypothetical protein
LSPKLDRRFADTQIARNHLILHAVWSLFMTHYTIIDLR